MSNLQQHTSKCFCKNALLKNVKNRNSDLIKGKNMKKSILATAVAVCLGAPAIAMADATLYGHVMIAADKVKDEKLHIGSSANSESRIGLRGTADTGIEGLQALYQYEFGVNTTQTSYSGTSRNTLRTRQANVGLTGGFGTVKAGSQTNLHDNWVTTTTDVWLSSVVDVAHSTATAPARLSNSLAYVSPDFNGFQFALATAANSEYEDKNFDLHHIAAKYKLGGFYAAASHIDYNSTEMNPNKKSESALALSYDFGPAMIAAVYSHVRNDLTDNYKPWDIAATYNLTDSTTLKAGYGDFKEGAKGYGVELQHNLGRMVNVFVGYGDANSDLGDNDIFSAGMRVRF